MSGVEQAQRYFSDRGVQEETFKRYRIEIVSTPSHEQLVEWLGENSYCLEAAIVFPNLICDPDTAELSIHAHYVRCFPPPIGSDGKPRKFLATLGSSYRPYVLPEILDVAYDIAEPIYIVEKQAAALLLRQNGLHAIALDGTFGSAAKRVEGEPVKLHEVLSEWDWVGRPLYLCFDSDFRKRQSVLQGLVRTYILFTIAGAVVKVLQWDAQFTGLDDFVASRAGLDIEKQRPELTTLASAAGADARQAAADWIIPQYRGLFETEVAAILPNEGQRSLLADIVYKALGTTPGDLKKSWRNLTKPADVPASEVIVEETEPWPDPVIPSELGEKLLGRWKQHVITSDVNYWTLVLWQILTHLKDSLSLMPQLGLCSALKRCGKTRTLEVLEQTVWKGLLAASVSPAATIRTIEKYEPCFLIDEFDAFLSQNEEFRGVLNTCHSRGVKHIRCQPETHEPQAFNAFCAVAIALIGELPGTVEDRAIVLHLERKQVSERVVPVRKVPSEIFITLRREIRRFALDYAKEVLTAIPVLPKLTNDRALENWEPLGQIAAVLGDPWPRRAFLAAKLLTPSDSDLQDFTIQLLVALKHLFLVRGLDQPGREEELLLTEQILLALNKDKEAPWADQKQYFHGLTAKKLSVELRRFRVKSRKNSTTELHGYCWKDLVPHFRRYLGDEDPPPGSPPPPSTPSASEDSPEESSPISSFSEESSQDSLSSKKFSKPPFQSGNPAVTPYKGLINKALSSSLDSVEKEKKLDLSSDPASDLNDLYTTTYKVIPSDGRIKPPGPGQISKSIPPSTPQAPFCTPSHPERLVFLDLETFHPYEGDYPQPPDKTAAQLLRKQNKGEAHPWAKDPRRCVLRFLTVHDTESTFGSSPLTIDFQENPELPANVLEALANCTIVGHNLDFDITVLRRYGIPVSNSILDTMIASRLLGMGKEKFKVPETAYCDLSDEELDERTSSEMEDPNPVDNEFPGVAEYQAKAAENALILDCVRTAGGQRRWLPPLLESDQEDNYWPSFERRKKILMNTPIQGGQADVLIRAVNKFMPKLPKEVEVVNLVHDEVDVIVTPETLSIAVEVIGNAFREAFVELYGNVLIPNIKFSKGSSWGELQNLSE